jgi:hypothetical protein
MKKISCSRPSFAAIAVPAAAAELPGQVSSRSWVIAKAVTARTWPAGWSCKRPSASWCRPTSRRTRTTGIGNYSAEDFKAAMTKGIAPGGKRLYPAMPYPYYAHLDDRSLTAMWSYLRTVKPVKKRVNVNQLRFPYNLRIGMLGWNALFYHPKPIAQDAAKSARGIAAPIW